MHKISYRRVRERTENPSRDKRCKHGPPSKEAFLPGEIILVESETLEATEGVYYTNDCIYAVGVSGSWLARNLPDIDLWSVPTTPTPLEWLELHHRGTSKTWLLERLLLDETISRADIERVLSEGETEL